MLEVDPGLATPPYQQIKNQIMGLRTSGEFPPGHRLPPVRHLAVELGVAPTTAARAYRELEAAGVIETRGRHGSYVTEAPTTARRQATAAARDYLSRLRSLGMTDAEAVALLRDVAGP